MAVPTAAGVPTGPVIPMQRMNTATRTTAAPAAGIPDTATIPVPPLMPKGENMPFMPTTAYIENTPVTAEFDMSANAAVESPAMAARSRTAPYRYEPEACGHGGYDANAVDGLCFANVIDL